MLLGSNTENNKWCWEKGGISESQRDGLWATVMAWQWFYNWDDDFVWLPLSHYPSLESLSPLSRSLPNFIIVHRFLRVLRNCWYLLKLFWTIHKTIQFRIVLYWLRIANYFFYMKVCAVQFESIFYFTINNAIYLA